MLTIDVLRADIRANWAALYKDNRNRNLKPKSAAENAHQIFKNTFDSGKDYIVIGPDCLRDKEGLAKMHGLITIKKQGALLGEKEWSLLINDCFLLAAIRGKKKVVIVNFTKECLTIERIWDKRTNTLTTMGRELAILQEAGYIRALDEKGVVLVADQSKPYESLQELWDRIKMTDPKKLLNFIGE